MRFILHIDDKWQMTSVPNIGYRAMQRVLTPIGDFPRPEVPPLGAIHTLLCSGDVDSIIGDFKSLQENVVDPGMMERFGRYLFECLLGEILWQRILTASNGEFIELALKIDVPELQRLHWEMMYSADGFLLAGRHNVALTRIVSGSMHPALPLKFPPRLLFVVGTTLSDPQIHPAMEYLALLHQVELKDRIMHSRILEAATPSTIREMMQRFHPDVVYFASHGGIEDGRGYLMLKPDEMPGQVSTKPQPFFADQLLQYLRVDGQYPPIVVLSACDSGASGKFKMSGTKLTTPLAVELVRGGVPIVVGMSGQIADDACRLFTRRFGEALVLGEVLTRATAEGRRAAIGGGYSTHRSVDWAFLTLFMSEGSAADYQPLDIDLPVSGNLLSERLRGYGVKGLAPVFCARGIFIDAYDALFKPMAATAALSIYTPSNTAHGVGRTRLLQELLTQALRDGHIPLPLLATTPDWEPSRNAGQLGIALLRAVAKARMVFNVPPLNPNNCAFLKLLLIEHEPPEYDRWKTLLADQPDALMDKILSTYQKIDLSEIQASTARKSLAKDFAALRSDICAKYSELAHAHVLVLLDELQRYDKAVILPLFDDWLDSYGMGTAENPVPVVLAFSLNEGSAEFLRPIAEKQSGKPWLRVLKLDALDENEDMLALERIWLHPCQQYIVSGVTDEPLVINPDASTDSLKLWYERFRRKLLGLPGRFYNETVLTVTEFAIEDHFLVRARDKDLLDSTRENT